MNVLAAISAGGSVVTVVGAILIGEYLTATWAFNTMAWSLNYLSK